MDLRLSFLLSAAIVFVGTHIILTHHLRSLLMGLLGKAGFLAAYSLIAFVTLGWTIFAFASPSLPVHNTHAHANDKNDNACTRVPCEVRFLSSSWTI